MERYIQKKDKELFLFGEQVAVFDVRSFYYLKKELKSRLAGSDQVFYNAGKLAAQKLVINFINFLGGGATVLLSDKRGAMDEIVEALNYSLGLGTVSILEFDPAKPETIFKIEHSAEAQEYVNKRDMSVGSICHATAGIFAGLCEALFEMPIKCSETNCIAKGDNVCKFVVEKSK